MIFWHRGTYRSSAEKWFNPEGVQPQGDSPAVSGKGMQTKLNKGKMGQFEISFKIPQKLAPLFLAFSLVLPGTKEGMPTLLGPAHSSPHFATPVGLHTGDPLKYGEPHIREPIHIRRGPTFT